MVCFIYMFNIKVNLENIVVLDLDGMIYKRNVYVRILIFLVVFLK